MNEDRAKYSPDLPANRAGPTNADAEQESEGGSPPLSAFPLDTHDGRVCFLRELYMQGYPAVFEAVSHAWKLMQEPKAARCTYNGIIAGTGGTGKKALYNFFRNLISEALAVDQPIPTIGTFRSLEAWDRAVRQQWDREADQVEQIIQCYAGLMIGQAPAPLQQRGNVLVGPWPAHQ